MAFFSSKKNKPMLKKVRPTIVKTQNVAKELLSFAKSYGIKVESLDFSILEVQTFTKEGDDASAKEWEEISGEELYELDDVKALLNPKFQIKQVYEIEIFSKNTEEDPYRYFNLAIGVNATKCKVYLSIQDGSVVSYSKNFERDLLALINKNKVRAGILINIFDEMLPNAISQISAFVRVEETAKYNKNETVLIAQGFEPTATINDDIVYHYNKKEEVDAHSKVDYASRGFIHSVLKDELIIEYVKAKEGKPGRNCRGEFMASKEPLTTNAPTFKIDESIKEINTPNSIEYRATVSGYVVKGTDTFSVQKELDVGEISFKTTGSISSGLDSDISINVKETDAMKDAIGTGMNIEVSEIEIEGNIGPNSTVNAIKATVGGQTHKTSQIRAHNLKINTHRGTAYGKNIHITRLEHGIVDGDVVEIGQTVGGKVKAREIVVELCGSYLKATASKLIEIKKLQGSENIFTIDPLLKRNSQGDLGNSEKEIKGLENAIKDTNLEINKYTTMLENNLQTFNSVKKRLIHYKNNGVKMPESFVKQYNNFKKAQDQLANITKELLNKEEHLLLLTNKTLALQDNIFDARVINREHWIGHNEIRFKLINPPIELVYKPQQGSVEKIFGLVKLESGEFVIQAVSE